MSSRGTFGWAGSLAVGALAAALWLAPTVARAEGPATPTGKGIAGGIMLGAEVVMIPIAIAGIEDAWPYPVFGTLGAIGGGIGGYFVEQTGSAEGSIYMLAGGMALVIPTVVAVLNVTMYGVEDNEADDEMTDGTLPGELEGDSARASDRTARKRRPVHFALVGVDDRGVGMGIPAITVEPTYTPTEVAVYGAKQGTDVSVSLVSGTF